MKKIRFSLIFVYFLPFYSYTYEAEIIREKYLKAKIDNIKEIEELNLNNYKDEILKKLTLFEYYLDKKELETAQKYAEELKDLYPISQLVNFRLAEYYFLQKDYENSKNYFQQCVKNDSRFHEARSFLAKTFYLLKDYENALRHYNVLSWFKPEKDILSKLEYLVSYLNINGNLNKKTSPNFSEIYTSSATSTSPYINVGISTKDNGNLMKIDAVKFLVSNDFEIYNMKGEKILQCEGKGNREWTIVYRTKLGKFGIISPELKKEFRVKSEILTIKPISSNSTFLIKEYKWFKSTFPQNIEIRGELIIRHLKEQIVVINNLKLDEYLYSVVTKEIGKDKPKEALKTQAVIARTVALYRKNNKVHKYFDVCSGQHCQVYEGVRSEAQQTIQAVDETLGEVITYNDKLISAFFHANCGGVTSSGKKFQSEKEYLSSVSDIIDTQENIDILNNLYQWYLMPPKLYCKDSEYVHLGFSRWFRITKKDELSKHLNKKFKIGKLKNISVLERYENGYIKKLKIVGDQKSVVLTKEHLIRNITPIPLRSSSFLIEFNGNTKNYYFWGAGWGHGVGMCQSGSCGLAEVGENYINIIKHYFKNTDIKKLY